jgi:hypothetical protein
MTRTRKKTILGIKITDERQRKKKEQKKKEQKKKEKIALPAKVATADHHFSPRSHLKPPSFCH